ncbi:MAG: HAD family phosphatase [Clostridium sp.]|nr:HAD family phosphatase [Clostridium sp.]
MVGVIFDFKGTLFKDSDKHEKAWEVFSNKVFQRDISQEEFKRFIQGHSSEFIVQYLSEVSLSQNQIIRYVEEKESIYRELCDADKFHTRLTWDVKLLLGDLKERRIPMTIATDSPGSNMEYYIKKFHLEKWFDIEKTVFNDGTIHGKPNPDLYILAAEAIHVKPQDCIVFEDTLSGIQAAYNAGVRKIMAVVPNAQKNQFEELPGVCDVISSFHNFDRFFLRV